MAYFTKEILFQDLLNAQNSEWETEAVIIGSKCCEVCLKFDKTTLDLDEAILIQPLPNPKCTRNNGCVCYYGFRGKSNDKGRLIRKK